MKKLISILLVLILFVGFLESLPKYFIVETKEGTTKPTDNQRVQEKHHGCVDHSTGRKYKVGEELDLDTRFATVCGCHFMEKKCKWALMNYAYDEEKKIINTEGECKKICHSSTTTIHNPDEVDEEALDDLHDCLKECSYHAKKGLFLREEIQNGLNSGNATGKTESGRDTNKYSE